MGLWDTVKDAGKAVKDKAVSSGKTISAELQRREESRKLKHDLLANFYLEDMEGICKKYGYSGPQPYKGYVNGRRYKVKLERKDWFSYCMGLPIDKLKKYAYNDRRLSRDAREVLMQIDNIEKEELGERRERKEEVWQSENENDRTETDLVVQPSKMAHAISDFDEILSYIETKYQRIIADVTFSDEDQFTDNLYAALRAAFPNMQIENTRRLYRDSGDIFINGKYVLELKFADNEGTLNKGLQESLRYKEKNYPGMAFIILDIGQMQSKLAQYQRGYERDDAKVIILSGKGARKKVKKTFIFREK